MNRKPVMPRFSAAIFDLDGTLIDTERLLIDTCLETLLEHGHAVPRQVILAMVGVSHAEGQTRLSRYLGHQIDMQAFDLSWEAATSRRYAMGIPPMPGVGQLLLHLAQAAVPVAVATNSATANARAKLTNAGLHGHFHLDHVVGYDAVAWPKPAPDVFLAAAARLGVAPDRCVAFEDSETGVAAALAAGMTVVHVPDMAPAGDNGAHHRAESILQGARACGLID